MTKRKILSKTKVKLQTTNNIDNDISSFDDSSNSTVNSTASKYNVSERALSYLKANNLGKQLIELLSDVEGIMNGDKIYQAEINTNISNTDIDIILHSNTSKERLMILNSLISYHLYKNDVKYIAFNAKVVL